MIEIDLLNRPNEIREAELKARREAEQRFYSNQRNAELTEKVQLLGTILGSLAIEGGVNLVYNTFRAVPRGAAAGLVGFALGKGIAYLPGVTDSIQHTLNVTDVGDLAGAAGALIGMGAGIATAYIDTRNNK